MNKYIIEITETLQKQIEIEANSKEDALKLAKNKYRNEEIILDSENYVTTDFDVINEFTTKRRETNRTVKNEHER